MYDKPVWLMLKEAIDELGGRATHRQLKYYIRDHYGDVKDVTVQCHFILCAVNHPSRVHYGQNRKPRMAGGKYDFLYRPQRGVLERYDPDRHGVWGIVRGGDGKPHVGLLEPPLGEPKPEKPVIAGHPRDLVESVYRLVNELPCYDHATPPSALPRNAVYFLFEAGEHVQIDGQRRDRIVRVGTHRGDGRFPARIRSHYGNASSLRGHKNTSIVRMNVGGAIMSRYFPQDGRLEQWMTQGATSVPDIEETVSKYLREIVTFACVPVESERDRLDLERGLIALLAQNPLAEPSEDWLGRSATSPKIVSSGMWNAQHVNSEPLSFEQFKLLQQCASTARLQPYESANWRIGRAGGGAEPKPPEERERRQTLQGMTLVVVPCGKSKIWREHPELGPVQAKDAYTGQPFRANRAYAEKFGDAWVILSAKYGFLFPEMLLAGDYDVTFRQKNSPELVPPSTLKRQVELLRLGLYDNVVVLGGNGYREAAAASFEGSAARLHFPFRGLRQGEMIAAAKRAVENDNPFGA